MVYPYEFQTLQTLMAEEVRTDEETGEQYIEEVIIAEDKKLRQTIDLENILSYSEITNNKGSVYKKRCVLETPSGQIIVAKSYDDIKELLTNIKVESNKIGFGREQEDTQESS